MELLISSGDMDRYLHSLREAEKSNATIDKYARDLSRFQRFARSAEPPETGAADGAQAIRIAKSTVIAFKQSLCGQYAPASVNSMLAALNGFLSFLGFSQLRVKALKTQKQLFCSGARELTKAEYYRLLRAAETRGNERLRLIMQSICSTGIRISELRHITAEAVAAGRATVDCKGKLRVILLPKELCRKLSQYCKQKKIKTGCVFVTKNGRPVNRSNVWLDMKRLCAEAGVDPQKVFPHNLRHLFARTYYALEKDLNRLADLLGHSSVETTRIYTVTDAARVTKRINELGLVV